MVSNASDDLPDPDRPVNTISASRGISRSTFLRLCSRAPRTWIVRWTSAGDLLTILAIGSVLCLAPSQPPLQRGRTLGRRPPGNDRGHADVLVDVRPVNAFAAGGQAPRAAFFRRGVEQPRIPRQRSRNPAPIREIDSQGITGHGNYRRK